MSNRVSCGSLLAAMLLFASGPWAQAQAADIYKPAYEPPPQYDAPPPPEVSSGWYVGGLVGYGMSETDFTTPGSFSFDADGAIGGGLLGWNYRNSGFIVGLEGDILAGGMEGSQVFGANTVNGSVDWIAGLRARAGFNVTPEIMLFAALGMGWADIDLPVTGPGGGGGSEVFSGIQYGGGAEVAVSQNWSIRMDYLYTDLDSETITYPGGNTTNYDPDIHQLRAGLLLRF